MTTEAYDWEPEAEPDEWPEISYWFKSSLDAVIEHYCPEPGVLSRGILALVAEELRTRVRFDAGVDLVPSSLVDAPTCDPVPQRPAEAPMSAWEIITGCFWLTMMGSFFGSPADLVTRTG